MVQNSENKHPNYRHDRPIVFSRMLKIINPSVMPIIDLHACLSKYMHQTWHKRPYIWYSGPGESSDHSKRQFKGHIHGQFPEMLCRPLYIRLDHSRPNMTSYILCIFHNK